MTAPVTLHPLRAEDADEVLAFERANRAYFARTIGDRGDEFFAAYPHKHAALLGDVARGDSLLYLVRDAQGTLVGRVNFTKLRPGPASLGYRFTQSVGGRGYATAAIAEAMKLARAAGLCEVQALAALSNPASKRVLEKQGFVRVPDDEQGPQFVERNGERLAVEVFCRQLKD